MNSLKKFFPLALLLLSIPLMGAKSEDVFGCGCGGGGSGDEEKKGGSSGEEIPGGGGVAASTSYSIDRSEMGMSWEKMTSKDDGYQVSGTVGHFLSQGRTLSDNYLVHHPMSREVITEP